MDEAFAMVAPNTDPDSLDLRCGRNASTAWSQPKTAVVQAGDRVGFAAGDPMLKGDLKPWMYHPGYASAWLSKTPDGVDLNSYDGDGDWFKILNVTGRTEQSLDYSLPENEGFYDQLKSRWGTFRLDSYNFSIPAATPAGSYLLRFEHIFPNPVDAQFYVNCAHIEVQNPAGSDAEPGPVAKIPGVYERGQPDIYFSSYDIELEEDIINFVQPGPQVWP
ncbi:hypothetical protein N3K66_004127 [Trichothecium roseum]|uniref:Uncharacterized protein n=1 Tax=Trichothecium roseum TaxID=47278 RepID=A0ACC0V0D9_9HYPO|nr:hypothetical protein N3K66_004127 [Trichothecium roseum]